ncbi:hypothetical protein TSUD_362790 [Trifolium subterraneum]|uniref:Disease resistance protein At4g27190-like leucine-rich repeats domain-containing protein n=1 Tax=Trifolium subterraneum TaxID=3900 RepID=A0A2Z6P8N9_TRISU|nr:hypothetical protein TSUD_362790 [Trifolium subterraneum]
MEEISLSEHYDLQKLWNGGFVDLEKSWLYNLKTLRLEDCDNLSCAMPSNIFLGLKSLKELEVRHCDNVGLIFGNLKNDNKAVRSQLKNLTLEGLSELKHVWGKNYQGKLMFKNLLHVSVIDCEGLKTLFPAAVAKNIKKLETLKIESCENLLDIVGKEVYVGVAADDAEKFVFPCLTSLHLNDLPKLICFYCEIFTVECPELHKLVVLDCPRLELFQITRLESEDDSTSISRQPLFPNFQVISFLEILSVDWIHSSVLRSSLQLTKDLNLLKTIRMFFDVDDDEKPILNFDILNKAPNLRDLSIEWCKSLEIFHTPNLKISEQLKIFTLDRVSELKFIWSEDSSWLNIVLTFSYLKELYIEECHGLEYLFASSVAKVLMHLEKITVKECESIKHIVEMEQDGTTSPGVKLEWLYSITLDSLSSLECFYSGNDTLQLPSLTLVNIQQCPKMDIFSRGTINAKSFRGIHNSVEQNDELIFHHDLNVSVKVVFLLQFELFHGAHAEGEAESNCTSTNRQPLIPNLDAILILEELCLDWKHISALMLGQQAEDLKFVKKSYLYFDFAKNEEPTLPQEIFKKLPSLQDLRIGWINNLMIFLTKNTNSGENEILLTKKKKKKKKRKNRILGQLKILTLDTVTELQYINLEDSWLNTVIEKLHDLNVTNCPDLKNLFHSPCAVSFSCMKELHISECHGLRYLFTCSIAKVLTSLEKITVEESQSITEIVAKEQDGTTSQEVKFEQLCYISLNSLSSLECFYSGNGSLQLPSLTEVYIWQCPKLKVFSLGEINANLFKGVQASSDSNNQLVFHNDLNASVKRVFLLEVRLLSNQYIMTSTVA